MVSKWGGAASGRTGALGRRRGRESGVIWSIRMILAHWSLGDWVAVAVIVVLAAVAVVIRSVSYASYANRQEDKLREAIKEAALAERRRKEERERKEGGST
ncbi:MAG: hypothetical protein WC683_03845 [bacterium]